MNKLNGIINLKTNNSSIIEGILWTFNIQELKQLFGKKTLQLFSLAKSKGHAIWTYASYAQCLSNPIIFLSLLFTLLWTEDLLFKNGRRDVMSMLLICKKHAEQNRMLTTARTACARYY